jgi:hypothetical protein
MIRRFHLSGSFTILGLVILLFASPGAQASGAVPAFICSANGVSIGGQLFGPAANPLPTCASESPPPQQNFNQTFHETFGTVTIKATNLHASTTLEAVAGKASADASLENLTVTIATNGKTNTITADQVTAHAQATCVKGFPIATGQGTVENLNVNGQPETNPTSGSKFDLPGFGTLLFEFGRGGGSQTSDNTSNSTLAFFTSANTLMVAPDFSIPLVGAGVSNCTPGVPPTGGGPIAPAGGRSLWLIWGALLATPGLVGVSGTLVARRYWLR